MGKDISILVVTRRWLGRLCLRLRRILSNPSTGLRELQFGVCSGENRRMSHLRGNGEEALTLNNTSTLEMCTINSLQIPTVGIIIRKYIQQQHI